MVFASDRGTSVIVQVLPALMQQLVKEGEVVRAPVALALVKLIRLLPARAEQVYLPAVLQQVANVLKLRLQRIRSASQHAQASRHHLSRKWCSSKYNLLSLMSKPSRRKLQLSSSSACNASGELHKESLAENDA